MAAFPIFVVDDAQDVIRFDNDREMQWMEATDVEGGIYRAFDALGRPISLKIVQVRRKFLGLIPKLVDEVIPGEVNGDVDEKRASSLARRRNFRKRNVHRF